MERAADGVWLMRGGFPHRTMNVYFIEEAGGGVTVFDAGISAMTRHGAEGGRIMGGIHPVLLGHAHYDHRGAAPGAGRRCGATRTSGSTRRARPRIRTPTS